MKVSKSITKDIKELKKEMGSFYGSQVSMAPFVNYSDEVVNPLFIWYLKPEYARAAKWTQYDLHH